MIADDLYARGIGVRIFTGKLSGSCSPTGKGKFLFTMMAFAELERDIIRERTIASLAAAQAQGRTGGRPTVMGADKLAAARARRARGESAAKIAKALGSAAPRSTGTWPLRASKASPEGLQRVLARMVYTFD